MRDRQRGADDDRGGEVAAEPVVDEVAVAAWPMSAVTVTRPTVVTVAMRSPAMIAGTASAQVDCEEAAPAACSPCRRPPPCTAAGTPSTPATMFRTRISSV